MCKCVSAHTYLYARAGIFTNHVYNANILSYAAYIRCLVVVVVVFECASACIQCVSMCVCMS